MNEKCPICKNNSILRNIEDNDDFEYFECEICGSFFIDSNASNYLLQRDGKKVSSYVKEQNVNLKIKPKITIEKLEEIEEARDKKIKEKFDCMMNTLKNHSKHEQLNYTHFNHCYIQSSDEFRLLIEKARQERLISVEPIKLIGGTYNFVFNNFFFEGIEYLESLEEPNKNSKTIFIAFNFTDELKDIFEIDVKKVIEDLGFECEIVNQNTTPHNKSITDEIIAKLKSSRILIADFTNHRNSVYFEAGFAMGMKIPIIWCCQDGDENETSFDTRQFPHIVWKDKEDLKEQIKNRIKVIL